MNTLREIFTGASRAMLYWSMAAATLIAALTLSALPSSAHEDPSSCNASGLQQFPSVGPAGNVYDGETLTYTVIYNNTDPDGTGSVAPCNVTGADATITLPNGNVINVLTNATLNVGDSISCPGDAECAAGPYTYAVNHANETGNSVTAIFDIDGVLHQDADEEVAADHDTLSKTVIHPSTSLSKQASQTDVVSGSQVTYTYTETNDGDTSLTNPSVTDDACAPVTYSSGDTNTNGILNPGESWVFTCTTTVTENTTNTAIGHGTDSRGNDITWCADTQNPPQGVRCDQDERAQASVRVVEPLTVVKTVNTTYDRDWDWTINKSADQTSLTLAEGASGTVNYTVSVSPTSENINHAVTGNITISNPTGNPNATIQSVSDVLNVSGAATVTCPQTLPFVLAGGSQLVCTYSQADASATDTQNTATVTTTGAVPGDSDTQTVAYGSPVNITDECVTVNDNNNNGPQGVVICENTADKTLEYSVTFGPSGGQGVNVAVACGEIDHPNVANFTTNDNQETGQDNWTVHVTVECPVGCTLTQGYWKTHSRQGPAPYDADWANLGANQENTTFFLSGMTWLQVFNTPPKGNAYYQLAHQYMAAILNTLTGAATTAAVDDAIAEAEDLFNTYSPTQFAALGKNHADRTAAIQAAGVLGSYNEGAIGPGHCE